MASSLMDWGSAAGPALKTATDTMGNMIALQETSRRNRALESQNVETQNINRATLKIAQDRQIQESNINDYKIKELKQKEEDMNKPWDLNTDPIFLSAPPESQKIAMQYSESSGYTKNGIGTRRSKMKLAEDLEKDSKIFTSVMAPFITSSKNNVLTSWQELQKAREGGKPDKIQEAQQKFDKSNDSYNLQAGNFDKGIKVITARENTQRLIDDLTDSGEWDTIPQSIKLTLTNMQKSGDETGFKEVMGKWAESEFKTNQAYKPGHIQYFDSPEGGGIYREFQANGTWKDKPELGGKVPPKGYLTMDEAVSEANRVLKKTPPDSGLVASAELGAGNKWIPKLMPNITLRIPAQTPTQTPGISFDRRTGKWSENLPDGSKRELSSEEVKSRRLSFMEETPVSDIKTMQQSVPSVLQLIKQSRKDMENAQKSLGPAAGRWSQFYSGKIGASNPEFRRLMTDVGLLQTRLMKMHVGARGGVEMMKHFSQYFNAAKDSPENLKAAFDAVEEYANEVGLPMAEQKKSMGKTEGKKQPLSAY